MQRRAAREAKRLFSAFEAVVFERAAERLARRIAASVVSAAGERRSVATV